eukprot:jgi/Chlat1/3659/Chrsp238S03646
MGQIGMCSTPAPLMAGALMLGGAFGRKVGPVALQLGMRSGSLATTVPAALLKDLADGAAAVSTMMAHPEEGGGHVLDVLHGLGGGGKRAGARAVVEKVEAEAMARAGTGKIYRDEAVGMDYICPLPPRQTAAGHLFASVFASMRMRDNIARDESQSHCADGDACRWLTQQSGMLPAAEPLWMWQKWYSASAGRHYACHRTTGECRWVPS